MRLNFKIIGYIIFINFLQVIATPQDSSFDSRSVPNVSPDSSVPGVTETPSQQKIEPAGSIIEPQAGCGKDNDCKGDRVCENGVCVSPHNMQVNQEPQLKTDSVKVTITERKGLANVYLFKYKKDKIDSVSSIPCTLNLDLSSTYTIRSGDKNRFIWAIPFQIPNKPNVNLLVKAGSKDNFKKTFPIFLGGLVIGAAGVIIGAVASLPTEYTDIDGTVHRKYSHKFSNGLNLSFFFGGIGIFTTSSIIGLHSIKHNYNRVYDAETNKELNCVINNY